MKIDVNKIKKQLKIVLNVFWQKLILVLLVFLLIDIVFGFVLFYSYYLKAQSDDPEVSLTLTVNKTLMDNVFSKWDEKEIKLQQVFIKEFPNFFERAIIEEQIEPQEEDEPEEVEEVEEVE
ncbi:MAG: hypothetical protein HQ539_02295 [Parcubacteria group bacterium]|nr:hypothetical protein [Parcubacteria group bacterium]